MTPDHSDIRAIEERMKKAARKLHAMGSEVGMAQTVVDYDSDRRKSLLARHAVKYLGEGDSAAAAEMKARADNAYDEEFNTLMGQYQLARTTIKDYENERISWESARSLLARQRVTLNTLPETEA